MDLKETDILGEGISQHWYYQSKAKAMANLLGKTQPSTILDVGAGSGFFSRYLLDTTPAKSAWCIDTSYNFDSDSAQNGKPIHFRRSIDRTDADLVLLMDVLEHVDDDVGLLRNYTKIANSGTRFLISVPAFQFLWSPHDIFLEHKRRYQLNQVEEVARRAGLKIIRGAYYFGSVFPIASALRLASGRLIGKGAPARSQLSKHSPIVNAAMYTLCHLELPFMRLNRLAGLTAFCVAEKA